MTYATAKPLSDLPAAEARLKAQIVVDDAGCHIWQGSTNGGGYGQLRVEGRNWLAHRLAFALQHGPLPSGRGRVLILHKCDVTLCCNPQHLYLGSHNDNARDRADRCRMSTGFRLWSRRTAEEATKKFGTVFYEFRGEVRPLHEWSAALGLAPAVLETRFNAGWAEADVVSAPRMGKRRQRGVEYYRRFSGVREVKEYLAEKAQQMN
jgi:hypothetical protein